MSFVDGIRRGKAIQGRIAAVDIGRVGIRPGHGKAGEEPADGRAESAEDQRMVEELEEQIRSKDVWEAIKPGHVDGNACDASSINHGSVNDMSQIGPGGLEVAVEDAPQAELDKDKIIGVGCAGWGQSQVQASQFRPDAHPASSTCREQSPTGSRGVGERTSASDDSEIDPEGWEITKKTVPEAGLEEGKPVYSEPRGR